MSYLVYIKQAVANLFKPPVTSEYPLAPKTFCQGVRGRVVNDVSQCILCGMCERSCPSGALTVDRKTGEWRIDPFSCIQCGACVEACPKKCLSMDPHYAMPGLTKTEIILTAVKKEGVSEVKKTVAAQNAAMLAMDDRSHIVNNVMKCVFCGMCERNCPAGAITVDRANRTWRIDLEACVNCGTCIDNCPRKCLSLGCYLGNRTEITVRGVSKIRRRPAGQPVMEEAQPPAAAEAAVADNHVKNEIEKCLFCGKCEKTCPVDAITIDRRNRTWTIDRNKCITCGACALDCPAKCLSLADTWGEGENKAAVTTYQGKVLTRRPRVRPAPPVKPAESAKAAPALEPVKDVPQLENPHHVKNTIEKCLFCGRCEHSCPMQAITIDRKTRKWTIDREKCVACGVCAENCPAKCLAMKEEWEEGEDKALVLTLTGKAPVRSARPAAKPAEAAKPAAEPPKAVPAPEVAKDVPQSENPHHVKNAIEKCLFCGRCEHSCPMQAITIDRKTRKWTIDREKCVACGVCAENCPAKCLAMKEEWEEGEDKALVLTLTGKAPVRSARPAAKPAEAAKPAAEPPKAVPAPEVAKDVPQSENPHHVKNAIEKCLFCGRCEHSCPMQAITIDRKTRKWMIDREKCVVCGVCAENCPAKCLAMKEEWEEGEDKALVLTLTGKAPVRPAHPAAKPAEAAKPAAEPPKAEPAPEPAEDVPQSENPHHVKNDIEKCLFCGRCEHSCPMQAITIDRKTRKWTIDREKCVACGVCAENCPAKCLAMKEEWEEGEDKALVLTLTGKAPVRPARPAAKPAEPPKAEAPKAAPAPEPAKDVPQSENPHHVKNTIEKCLFCGRCEHSCPMQAITIDRKARKWTIDREKCVACGVCAENCPAKCLAMKEEWEEGEDKALVLTLTGKTPVRPARPRPPVKKDEPHA